jgi:hypothetical protein
MMIMVAAALMVVVRLLLCNLTLSLRYVLDNSYTVQRLDPDTTAMQPLFAIPQGPGLSVYRSWRQPQQHS